MKNQQQQTEPKTYKQTFFQKVETTTTKTESVITEVVPNFVDRKVRVKDKFNNGNFITLSRD